MKSFGRCLVSAAIISVFLLLYLLPCVAEEGAPDLQQDLFEISQNTIKLPLKSVLMHALKNNLDITFAGLQPDVSRTDIMREQSEFDTYFSSQLSKYHDKHQVGNALAGSNAKADIYQKQASLDAKLQKKFTPGTMAELSAVNTKGQTDLTFQGLDPEYYGELMLSLTQPLLRDFGIEIGTSKINIATLNYRISENQFRNDVEKILFQVESIYWDLYFRIEDLAAKQRSLERAENLLREFKIRIDAGTLAPIEVYQAEAEVALRLQDVILAKSLVKRSEDDLKAALNLYDDERYWQVSILPMDKPEMMQISPVLTECVQTAFKNRPDFMQAKLNVQASNIQVKYTKNQTLPRLDLIGSMGVTGLAGRPQDTSGVFGPLYRATPSPYKGHWDDVYHDAATGDYYNYLIGIKIEMPLENRLARSQYSKAKVQKMQALTNLKNNENSIINDVKDAIRQVTDSYKVYDAAVATVKFSNEKLKAEQKKFEVGMSTTFQLLTYQDDLATAESTLAAAEARHGQALAGFSLAKGTLMDEKGLALMQTDNETLD